MALDMTRVYPEEYSLKALLKGRDSVSGDEHFTFMRKAILNRQLYCLELLRAGNEKDAAELIAYHFGNDHMYGYAFSAQGTLSQFADMFKDESILYKLIRDVYIQDGYGFPRKLIVKMKKLSHGISEDERLKGLSGGDPVTVYRASTTDNEKVVRNEISWTTNYDVAVFFAYKEYLRLKDMGGETNIVPLRIWKAEISRKKIITYCNDRNEYEVIQHHGVINAIMLPMPTDSEVERVMREHEERQMISILDAMNSNADK